MVYISGDTHRDFDRFYRFCEIMETTKKDLISVKDMRKYRGAVRRLTWIRNTLIRYLQRMVRFIPLTVEKPLLKNKESLFKRRKK